MRKRHEIEIGKKIGCLTVIEDLGTVGKKYKRRLKVRCDCGKEKEVFYYNIKDKKEKRCICLLKRERKKGIRHVNKHGKCNTRLYRIWLGMKNRCYNKNIKNYIYYGQKGIVVCDQWQGENGFITFYNWAINNGYSDNLSIDRINPYGNYEPCNCRWATKKEQATNKRLSKYNTSGYTGVYFNKNQKKWSSFISSEGKMFGLGYFKTKEEALKSRNDYIIANNLPHKIQEVIQ